MISFLKSPKREYFKLILKKNIFKFLQYIYWLLNWLIPNWVVAIGIFIYLLACLILLIRSTLRTRAFLRATRDTSL